MKKIVSFLCVSLVLAGCNFLDHEPDMRASIDTKEKVRLLLVSAYTYGNSAPILDFTSDNVVDNNAPDKYGHCRKLLPVDPFYNEVFGWKPVTSSGEQDSPKFLWDAHYIAIAAANQALLAIEKLEAEGINMDAEKGEALMIRAYHHFLLTMIFCQAYRTDDLSKDDLGIYYATEPETTVKPVYHRPSLTETYQCIQRDMEEALPLINDGYYSVPKYHFNIAAANAFATRFYVYTRQWEKALACANTVLGTDRATTISKLTHHAEEMELTDVKSSLNFWIDPTAPSNLLLYTTNTVAPYTIWSDYGRYQSRGTALDYSIHGAGPCWGSRDLTSSFLSWSIGSDQYGSFLGKFFYLFEYTDKVNGYGQIHGVARAFTTDETLLNRAEAKTYLNDIDGALSDLQLWCDNMNVKGRVMDTIKGTGGSNITEKSLKSFYITRNAGTPYAPALHQQELVPDWEITERQLPLIYACLHFRRIETFQDGLRLQDLKRYGIEFTHQQGKDPIMTMKVRDERLAIQLPQEVLLAGMEPNPRTDGTTIVNGGEQQEAQSTPRLMPAPIGLGNPVIATK